MSKSFNSPTARLLQSSRLFSLPRPLPQPALEQATSTGVFRASDTATLPYPTHQAITSPASSRFRGDWGLKRALPLKATSSSTPHIRVRHQDNAAHITDFESAADYTQTESKWRQMDVPIVSVAEKKETFSKVTYTQSVYEEDIDNTDPHFSLEPRSVANQKNAPIELRETKRWKFGGPWITGMQEGEFELYILNKITTRKEEFRRFLIERLVEGRVKQEQRRRNDTGEDRYISKERRNQLRQQIEDNFDLEEKRLRDDHAVQHLSSELTAAICKFLDLPGIRQDTSVQGLSVQTPQLANRLTSSLESDAVGPPSTHPGAGLSHIRTNAVMENHPLWGPQSQRAPVLSRVLRPINNHDGTEMHAKIGVGGIVTTDPATSPAWKQNQPNRDAIGEDATDEDLHRYYLDADRMVNSIEPDMPKGNKIWVRPNSAQISDRGNIKLNVSRGIPEAIAVRKNDVEWIHEKRRSAEQGVIGPSTIGISGYAGQRYSARARPTRRAMQGFDKELGRAPGQAPLGDDEALRRLKELSRQTM